MASHSSTMAGRGRTTGAAVIAAALLAGLSACALPSASVKTTPDNATPDQTTADKASGGANAAPAATKAAAKTAAVGDAVTIGGMNGEKLTLTLVKIVTKTSSDDGFSTPDSGKHYVSVQFRIADVGTAAYSDSPDNDATVLDAAGQSFQPDFATTTAGPAFADTVNIAPGGSELGYVTFQVPNGDSVAAVQFTDDSGFGSTAQWSVG